MILSAKYPYLVLEKVYSEAKIKWDFFGFATIVAAIDETQTECNKIGLVSPRISVVANVICNCGWCGYGGCKRRFDEWHFTEYVDYLVLISETTENLWEKFWKSKEVFESKGMKVKLGKTKMKVNMSKGEIPNSKTDPCGECRRVMRLTRCCVQNVRNYWFKEDGRKGRGWPTVWKKTLFVQDARTKLKIENFEPVEKLCNKVQIVNTFCCFGDRLRFECQWWMCDTVVDEKR